jgi:integrase
MGGRGLSLKLRYIDRFVDRHGHERVYFRRHVGGPRIPLPALDDPKFFAAYQYALEADDSPQARYGEGTVGRLILDYYASMDFRRTRKSSQATTRGILDRFAEKHGHRLIRQIRRKHIEKIIASMAATPAAANNLLKKVRALLNYALSNREITTNPTWGIKKFKEGTYHTWTEAELAQFEAAWPLGTKERTAYALALYTGQRRGDLVRMVWPNVDLIRNSIAVTQEKTGVELDIPIHRLLSEALDAWPRNHISILGKTTSASLGNLMADAIEKARLPNRCVLHGLRKAAARRMAEAGATPHQIAAVTGHKSLEEIERYTKMVSQRGLAVAAISKIGERNGL